MKSLFRIIGILEGISYLVLFGNMLIVKNMNFELYKKLLFPIGMSHGILFVAYIVLAYLLKVEEKWSWEKFFYISTSSVIPFGTFYADKNWLNKKY